MRYLLAFVALAFSSVPVAFAQGTDLGTIRGTVTDSTGAAIPNAKVSVIDVATNRVVEVTSSEVGEFEAPGLRSGQYRLRVMSSGFNTQEINGIVVTPGGSARADARLQVGTASEQVVVQSEAPLVQTDNPTIGSTISNAVLTEIPRDSRDYQSFLYLNPNITQGQGEGTLKFIGAQSYGASFSLDGQRSNGGVFGEPTLSQPSLETIGELTVLSNSFTAEYAGIANIRVTTKRGAAKFHGSLFYNNKNSALAAWNLQDKNAKASFLPTPARSDFAKPYFNLNEFGGSFGGPVPFSKKTFFFLAYERRLQNSPITLRNTQLPHPTLWAGDFSRLNNAVKPAVPAAVLPLLTETEVANNTLDVGGTRRFISIPQRLLNPSTQAIIKNFFPQVNAGAAINPANGRLVEYYENVAGTIRRHLGTMRVDHDFSDKDRFYAVYNGQANDQQSSAIAAPFIGAGLVLNERSNHTLSLSETHLFTPGLINELRGGFNSQPLFRRSRETLRESLKGIGFNEADIQAYGSVITPSALDTYGFPSVSFGTGFVALPNGGRNTFRPLDQDLITIGDTLTWIHGRQTFKAGADMVRNHAVDGFTSGRGNPRGRINYTGTGPDAFARFLLGEPANTVQYVNQFRPPMDVANFELGFFAQDDVKLTSRLTLNLGLRYEIITPFKEANDLLINFDPNGANSSGRKGRFVVPSKKTLDFADSRYATYGAVTADEAGVGPALVNTDYNNFAPRVGLAYRVTDRMVIRGGYGFFYPTSAAQGIRDPLATNQFQVGLTKRATAATPLGKWPRPLDGGTVTSLSGLISANWVPFGLQSPRIQQYNVTFERDLGWDTAIRVSYLGSKMSGLISGVDYNLLAPSNQPFGVLNDTGGICSPDDGDCAISPADRARKPFPDLGDYLTAFGNFGHGRSNAFQTEVNRRFTHGFQFNFSYTLLDQKSTAPDTGNSSLGGTAYNQFSPERDYGMDAFTSRHRIVTYGVLETPFGRGRHWGSTIPKLADYALGGWQLTWQGFAKSGTGFTPFWLCENCGPITPGNVGAGSIDATGGFYGTTFRPLVNGDPNVRSGDRIFNPDAFGLPPTGADLFDNPKVAVRNLLTGPGTYGLNLGIQKVFRIGEALRMQFGADFNNVLNHPLKSPDNYDLGLLGSFAMGVNATTQQPEIARVTPNPDFGRLITSYQQEGIDSRRIVRLRMRITF